ncbi:MAG: fibrobacter succinogenes major paralogous domain-containing protein [bacterium]
MKKVLLIIALFMLSLTLKGVEPVVKFYLEDGNSKEYRLEDFIEMSFVKSNLPYLMEVFIDGAKNSYNVKNISTLEFSDLNTLKINLSSSVENINIGDIDSITFIRNPYNQITIGPQTWMKKNLDVEYYRNGEIIPQVTDSAEWQNLKTGAWCYYNNDPVMGAIYGKLYNWYAVNDPRGLAPAGWRVPHNSDLTILLNSLGGEAVAGGKLKEAGTNHWQYPNTGATNESGFTALPGGARYPKFSELGFSNFMWTQDKANVSLVYSWTLSYDKANQPWGCSAMCSGLSVRCVEE